MQAWGGAKKGLGFPKEPAVACWSVFRGSPIKEQNQAMLCRSCAALEACDNWLCCLHDIHFEPCKRIDAVVRFVFRRLHPKGNFDNSMANRSVRNPKHADLRAEASLTRNVIKLRPPSGPERRKPWFEMVEIVRQCVPQQRVHLQLPSRRHRQSGTSTTNPARIRTLAEGCEPPAAHQGTLST